MNSTIGFIGGGNMASSIIGGLLNNTTQTSLVEASDVWVFDKNAQATDALNEKFNINVAGSNEQLVEKCKVVVLAVKPQVLKAVLTPLAKVFSQSRPLVISVVAGIQSATIEHWLEQQLTIVRVMPNTPALIGAGASGLYANARVTSEQKALTDDLVGCIGIGRWVHSEADIDSVTALSGSGPAYFMLFIKSLIDAGTKAGLDPQTAKDLAVQTAIGAAQLIQHSEHSISTLIENVTSPAGTTEQALLSFENDKLSEIVANAFDAAKTRSQKMALELAGI
ncbi:MAG: pyrroline-5-carboxylate reductase [Arenicella sp.]|jgi:pyrroline-5-carboxylate reductase